MPISRRFFIKSGSLTAISAALMSSAGLLAFGQKRGRENPDIRIHGRRDLLYYAKQETFEPYIGSIFRARGARGEVLDLKLVSVETYKPNPLTRITTGKSRQTDSFSLMFSASGELPTFSNIPALYHAALGKVELFLSPKGTKDGLFFYEAIINHLI
jgi:hypothetical protein